ncbi:oxidoreductase [Capsulimonas corticalis]|uniref:Oxidoreductase n=1 Tax=Capsulimonas corticalis TaxID=2219043 RepID=A0A402CVA0_9BACT|nr:FAD-binding protein [Capsulimonas corticalis]BDI30332.1 oxidoreductase [Capsulimonas corticalis]
MGDGIALANSSDLGEPLELIADVLVIGGGPAGAWAAWSAASRGARVVLADKGYLGSSGAAASGGMTLWHSEPDADSRERAKENRRKVDGLLSDLGWMDRVLEQTYQNVRRIEQFGYPFPTDAEGNIRRESLQGPEYLRTMRRVVKDAKVTVLDQSPALELLLDADGVVAGARGVQRQENRFWTVRAGAVVIATGGCAFLSKSLGCNVLTGDGALMAAEAGSAFSGMEFSNHYAPSLPFASVTKGLMLGWATYSREDGTVIAGRGRGPGGNPLGAALLEGPVYAILDKADPEFRKIMRTAQPNFFVPFDRSGIDPFTQRFPLKLRLEGTVRGTGGLQIAGPNCETTVPGLYAAGDAASREIIAGGVSGGGALNAAWSMSSGYWSGAGAAAYAKSLGGRVHTRTVRGVGRAALRPQGYEAGLDSSEIVSQVQQEVFPYDRNLFRTGPKLTASLERLHALWPQVLAHEPSTLRGLIRAREAAAMVAHARWMYASALERTESRGMHVRLDYPDLDPRQQHRLISYGLDRVSVRLERLTSAALAPENEKELVAA